MAFRGKLSAGCEPCRLAKKSCDLAKPECTRCVNGGKTCIGFRDVNKLRIIDESSQVVRKATQAKPPQLKRTFEQRADASSLAINHEQLSNVLPMREAPRIHFLDVSQASFFQTFVVPGHWLFMNDFVTSMTGKESTTPCVLRAAQACGMALITNQQNVPQGRLWSQAQYVEAVRDLNASLADPEVAKDEQTLFAVLLLCVYESLTCDATKGNEGWQAHVQGAAEMLRLRGLESAKTPVGAALFYELRPVIAVDCVWHSKPIPQFIREWPEHLGDDRVPGLAAVDKLFNCVCALADLRAAIATGSSTARHLYFRASLIEKAMVDWAQQISTNPKWRFSAVPETHGDQYGGCGLSVTHKYRSPRELGAWNMYRTYRLILSNDRQMLWKQIAASDRHNKVHGDLNFRLLRQNLVDEICGSVSCALGFLGPFGHPDSIVIQAYSLVWPLFFAGRCTLESARHGSTQTGGDGLRDCIIESPIDKFLWIVSKLRYIQKRLGLSWVGGVIRLLEHDLTIHQDFHKLIKDRPTLPSNEGVAQNRDEVPGNKGCADEEAVRWLATNPGAIRWLDLEEEADIVQYV